MDCLIFLKSPLPKVATMNVFIKGETAFIPDMVLIIFFISVFLVDHIVDRIFIAYICMHEKDSHLILLFLASSLTVLIPLLMQLTQQKLSIRTDFWIYAVTIILLLFGLDSIYLGVQALKGLNEYKEPMNMSAPKRFIHISEGKFFIFKTYCYVTILLKTIPQLMWMPILIIESNLSRSERCLALISISVNILILSLTISITFPVRKSKAVYTTCIPLVVNSISKFFATICASCVHLIVFMVVYRRIRFTVFLVLMPKFLIWLYPSYQNLVQQDDHLSNMVFVHGPCLALISTFIYIHPFHGTGTFFYYFFNLFTFLLEMFSIYAFFETSEDLTVIYFTLKVLAHGYTACFRTIDNLFTLRDVEVRKTADQDNEKGARQAETTV